MMREMQEGMQARVELCTGLRKEQGKDVMYVRATAYPYLSSVPDQRRSVSLKANIPGLSAEMGVAVIFRLLLALDYEVSKAWAMKVTT